MRLSTFLATLFTAAVTASAGPLQIDNIFIGDSHGLTVSNLGPHSQSISGTTTSGWSVTGEFCADGFCGGTGGPQTEPAGYRFTNATIQCIATGPCSALDLDFELDGTSSLPAGLPLTINFHVNGNVSGAGGISGYVRGWVFGAGSGSSPVLEYGLGSSGFAIGPQQRSTLTGNSGFGAHMILHVDSVSAGDTFNLTNLDATFTTDANGGSSVPEPSSWAMIFLGVTGLAVRRFGR